MIGKVFYNIEEVCHVSNNYVGTLICNIVIVWIYIQSSFDFKKSSIRVIMIILLAYIIL